LDPPTNDWVDEIWLENNTFALLNWSLAIKPPPLGWREFEFRLGLGTRLLAILQEIKKRRREGLVAAWPLVYFPGTLGLGDLK
jgi:hypothetical protein